MKKNSRKQLFKGIVVFALALIVTLNMLSPYSFISYADDAETQTGGVLATSENLTDGQIYEADAYDVSSAEEAEATQDYIQSQTDEVAAEEVAAEEPSGPAEETFTDETPSVDDVTIPDEEYQIEEPQINETDPDETAENITNPEADSKDEFSDKDSKEKNPKEKETTTKSEDTTSAGDKEAEEDGASIHKEQNLYEVMLFGEDSESLTEASGALVEASKEESSVENLSLYSARMLAAPMFAALAAADEDVEDDPPYPRRADGSDVEAISIRWISKDTEDDGIESRLYLVPDGDSAFSVRFQVDYALSGEHNYEPGDIQIKIPAQVFHKRNSNTTSENDKLTGNMVIPLAQSPSTNTDFNWMLVDGEYILTNTKKIVAATKGFVQFEIKNLIPHEIVDMSLTDALQATIEVTTHLGNTIGLKSNKIDAQVNTTQQVVRANKNISGTPAIVSAASVGNIPESIRTKYPDDTEFLVVTWYANAYHTGNQPYTLTGYDTRTDVATGATTTTLHDGWVIGGDSETTKDLGVVQKGWYTPGTSTTSSIKVAYPMSQFEKDTTYTFTNHVDYDLTPLDGVDSVTHAEANGKTVWSYRDPVWVDPVGHFNVFKWGNDNDYGGAKSPDLTTHNRTSARDDVPDVNGTNTSPQHLQGWYGLYKKALNEMREGNDVEIAYTIKTDGYILPWTYEGDTRKEESYGKRPVTMVTEDTGLWVGSQSKAVFDLVQGKDYDFTSLSFTKPIISKIKAINVNPDGSFATKYISVGAGGTADDGTFVYERDYDDSKIPPIVLEIQRNGKWETYATADYSSGSCVITKADGTVINGDKIDFPDKIENFRTSVTSGNAAVVYSVRPSVIIYNTQQWKDLIESLFENNPAPAEDIWNGTNMKAYTAEGSQIVDIDKNGYDRLMGYTADISAIPYKSGTVGTIDYGNKEVTLRYTARVEERSVITDLETYLEAIEDELIQSETSGTWYDLLPIGVNPVMDTIRLRGADNIKDAYTIPNYKNTGRTMLVVEADLTPTPQTYTQGGVQFYEDVPTITFQAKCDINYIIDYGQITDPDELFSADLHNVIVFESGNDTLGSVEGYQGEKNDPEGTANVRTKEAWSPDAADAATEKTVLKGLDDGRDTESFLYAGVTNHVEILNAASTSLLKEVSVNNDGWWSQGTYYGNREENARDVYEGGMYSYRIFMMSNANTLTRSMILYDSLENYVAIEGNDQEDVEAIAAGKRWRGTLRSVDTSLLEKAGIDPVVYYSTIPELKIQEVDDPMGGHPNPETTDISDTSVWVKASDYKGDLADVHAIAIDCRKALDGSEYILKPETTVAAYINMWAPQGEEADEYIEKDYHAYNNIFLSCISVDQRTGGEGDEHLIRQDYVKVGLVENQLTVIKEWDDDDDRDGIRADEITFTLYRDGKKYEPLPSDNPNTPEVENPVKVKADENGDFTYTFRYLPYCDDDGKVFTYTVKEDVPEGYTNRTIRSNDGKTITIKNVHIPETTEVHGTKTWVGDTDDVRPAVIQVDLYADGELADYKRISPDSAGFWNYSFTNIPKYRDHGVEIVYMVDEHVIAGSSLDSYIPTVDGTDITNTYHPFGEVELKKSVVGATSKTTDDEFTFEITVTDKEGTPVFDEYEYDILKADGSKSSSGKVATGESVSIKADETLQIHEVNERYTVTATESVPAGYTVVGKDSVSMVVKPNDMVSREVTNRYKTEGLLNLRATKTLSGREMRNYQFRFNVTTDEAGEDLVTAVSSRIDGSVVFDALKFSNDDDGKTYTYYINELDFGRPGYTYDDSIYKVEVSVSDNGDGTMTATPVYYKKNGASWAKLSEGNLPEYKNEYHAEGDLEVTAWKVLKKRNLKADEFTFELVDADGTVVSTAKNDGNGVITFPKIHFTEKDTDKTYTYTVREKAGRDNTVIYSGEIYTLKVKVFDNGDGILSFDQTATDSKGADATTVFTNDLEDGKLAVEKIVEDGTDGEFKFKVKFSGEDVPEDGKYEYTKEQIGSVSGTNETNSVRGASSAGGTKNAPAFAINGEKIKAAPVDDAVEENFDSKTSDAVNQENIFEKIWNGIKSAFKPMVVQAADGDIAEGTTKGGAHWRITSSGELIIGTAGTTETISGTYLSSGGWEWNSYRDEIKKISFSGTVKLEGRLEGMFAFCHNLTNFDKSGLDTSGATNLNTMFRECTSLTTLNLRGLNTSSLRYMAMAFMDCSALAELDVYGWDVSNVVETSGANGWRNGLFDGCSSLKSLDLSTWELGKDPDFATGNNDSYYMFRNCSSLEYLDISGFYRIKADAYSTFPGCSNLKKIVLGSNVLEWRASLLPAPSTITSQYTGKWIREPDNGIPAKTPTELQNEYPENASSWAGTWVWEEKYVLLDIYADDQASEQIGTSQKLTVDDIKNYVVPEYDGENVDLFIGWVPTMYDVRDSKFHGGSSESGGYKIGTSDGSRTVQPNDSLFDAYVVEAPSDATEDNLASRILNLTEMYGREHHLAFYPLFDSTYTFKYAAEENGSNIYANDSKITKSKLSDYTLKDYTYNDRPINGWKLTAPTTSPFNSFTGTYAAGTKLSDIKNTSGKSLADAIKEGSVTDFTFSPVFLTTYQVDFKPGEGGSGSMSSITDQAIDEALTLPASTFKKFNHHIKEWSGSDGKTYADQGTIPANSVKSSPLTLTAVWEKDDNSVNIKDGEFEFTLRSNERAIFDDIAAGTAYQVWEDTPEGWVLVKSVNAAGKIEPLKTSTATFTNEYNPDAASIQLTASKTLDGQPADAGAFTFTLSENGSVIQTKTNAAGGGVTFDIIKYTRDDIGTHTYTIAETAGNDASITYDSHTETVTVTVKDDGKGNLTASASPDMAGLAFKNTTQTGNFSIEKKVTGPGAPADAEFTFVVIFSAKGAFSYTGSKTGTIRSGGTITLKAGEKITVNNLPAGTTYSVSETKIPTDFELSASSGESGSITADQTAAVVFTNKYDTDLAAAFVNLQVRKKLEGATLENGQFNFVLYDSEGNAVDTAMNDASGKVIFDLLEFDKAGTYTYTVKEVAGSDDSINYDSSEKTITVTVKEGTGDAKGTLAASLSYDPDDEASIPSFTNSKKTGSILLTKSIYGLTAANESKKFSFTLTLTDDDGNEPDGSYVYKIYEYTDDEDAGAEPVEEGKIMSGGTLQMDASHYAVISGLPVGNRYIIEEADISGFTMMGDAAEGIINGLEVAGAPFPEIVMITNEYSSYGELVLDANKVLTGQTLVDEQFTFELYDEDGNIIAYATNDASGKISFPKIAFSEEDDGETFIYYIREANAGDKGYTYDAGEVKVSVTVNDNGDGTISFSTAYSKDGEEDNKTLNNIYEAEGDIVLQATKTLIGRDLEDGLFNFEVVDENGEVVATGTNDVAGNISFSPIVYNQDQVGDTYTYTIREVIPEDADVSDEENSGAGGSEETGDNADTSDEGNSDDSGNGSDNEIKTGYTYDEHTEKVTVTVEDTRYGTLKITAQYENEAANFVNTYTAAGSVNLEAVKKLSGRALEEGQFTFELYDSEGNVLDTKANDADGKAVFDKIDFTQDDIGKTYNYSIKEVIPEEKAPGYEYDTHTENVTLTIVDNGDGTLLLEPSYESGEPAFENVYAAKGSTTFTGNKTLTGAELKEGQFTFEVLDEDGNVLQTAANALDGSITFKQIDYDQDDAGKTFTYVVREVNKQEPGYTYDPHEETIIVDVTDNGDGTLTVETAYDEDGIAFDNVYDAKGSSNIQVTKDLTGRALEDRQFTFRLFDESGELIDEAFNDTDGIVKFPAIDYTLEDVGKTFKYTVSEVNDESKGYTFDTHTETITITVLDNGDGTLKTDPVYDEDGAVFTNIYKASGQIDLEAMKELKGEALKDGQFEFCLKNAAGDVIQTVKNDKDGKIVFKDVAVTEEDAGKTIEFTISEIIPEDPGDYDYDDHILKALVKVTDNGDGTLEAEASYEGGDLFVNKYDDNKNKKEETTTTKPEPTTKKITTTKKASGPKTGDEARTGLWIAILLIAACFIATIIVRRRIKG